MERTDSSDEEEEEEDEEDELETIGLLPRFAGGAGRPRRA